MESINNGRSIINSSIEGTEIIIPAKKNWFNLLFGIFFLGVWFYIYSSSLPIIGIDHGSSGEKTWFSIIWISGWAMGTLLVTVMLLWGFGGKETFLIQRDMVVFSKKIGFIGTSRTLRRDAVKNIRFNEVPVDAFNRKRNMSDWGFGPGKIKFDYGMKTYSFGLGLDDAEAIYLIKLIKEKLV